MPQADKHFCNALVYFHFPLYMYPHFHRGYVNLPSYIVFYKHIYATLSHIFKIQATWQIYKSFSKPKMVLGSLGVSSYIYQTI